MSMYTPSTFLYPSSHSLHTPLSHPSSHSLPPYMPPPAPFPESEDMHIYDDIAEFAEEECYIATQGYARQAPDELDIDEGQLVCVIDDTHRGTSPSLSAIKF